MKEKFMKTSLAFKTPYFSLLDIDDGNKICFEYFSNISLSFIIQDR